MWMSMRSFLNVLREEEGMERRKVRQGGKEVGGLEKVMKGTREKCMYI